MTAAFRKPDDFAKLGRVIPDENRSGSITATPFQWIDPAKISKRRFLYGRHYVRQFVSVTVAPGGMGKSSLSIMEALSMVTGRSLLGEPVHERCRVWLWNGEDPFEELQRRIAAACEYHAITPEEIAGRLFVDSGRNMPLVVVSEGRDGIQIAEPIVDGLTKEIERKGIDVFIADPFVLTHQVNENSNTAIDVAARQWAKIADKTHVGVDLVHHARKGAAGQGEYTVEDGRGAGSLVFAARSARVLNRMTQKEATAANVDNHREFFRVDNGKSNLAPPAAQTVWRRIVSHPLANGDSVGVVTEWKWPDPLAGMTVADLLRVQQAIDGKHYRLSVQSKTWVGRAIAGVVDLDIDDETVRAKIKSMINVWLKSGALKTSELKDEKGTFRPIVEVGQWANT